MNAASPPHINMMRAIGARFVPALRRDLAAFLTGVGCGRSGG
jgi:hypothetical protein